MNELDAVLETGGAAAAELAASATASRGKCANCHEPLSGRFCSCCGQPADTHRRSVRHLVHEFVKDVVSFDSRILRTADALLIKPGELASAFRDGRTQRYVPPIRLYLFVSLLFFLALSFTNIALFQIVMVANPMTIAVEHGKPYVLLPGDVKDELPAHYADGKQHFNFNPHFVFLARQGSLHTALPADADARLKESLSRTHTKVKGNEGDAVTRTVIATMEKLVHDPAALNGTLTAWVPRALFLLLPLFALLLAAFYWRQRKTLYFVDHLVFSLNIHSFGFVLLLVAAALAQALPGALVFWLTILSLAVYLLLAMKRFYGQSWRWTGAKFAGVGFIYVFFFVLPAFGGIVAAAVMWG